MLNTNDAAHAQAYRADIDGLRAVSVLLVIAFHAYPDVVRGGFVGVDVFFVISGYLISSIIFSELKNGRFSFLDFYMRRVKRIFPALLVVLVAVSTFGWFALFPDEYNQLSKHVVAGGAFFSNIILWRESGYFDTLADTKPLLHLWSLGIEEQFYIVWPLLLWFAWKRKGGVVWALGAVFVVSFAVNVMRVQAHPVEAFYSPASRLWELLLGAALALIKHQLGEQQVSGDANRMQNVASCVGVVLLLLAVVLLNSDKAFPGWWALLPTSGAMLLIASGPEAFVNRTLLSNRALVFVGVISFPLYLWHWPLLSFARIINQQPISAGFATGLLIASGGLAWLTYRFVEIPTRHSGASPKVAWLLVLAALATGCAGYTVHRNDGFPTRKIADLQKGMLNPAAGLEIPAKWKCSPEIWGSMPTLDLCFISAESAPSIAVLGDSHAFRFFAGVTYLDTKRSWMLLETNSGPPLSGVDIFNPDGTSLTRNTKKSVAYLSQHPAIKTVVIALYGNAYIAIPDGKLESKEFPEKTTQGLVFRGLEKTVADLESSGKKVVLVIDNPELPFEPKDCLERPFGRSKGESCVVTRQAALSRQAVLRDVIARISSKHPDAKVYDSLSILCDVRICHFEDNSSVLYTDTHHLSLAGSSIVARSFLPWFEAQVDQEHGGVAALH